MNRFCKRGKGEGEGNGREGILICSDRLICGVLG